MSKKNIIIIFSLLIAFGLIIGFKMWERNQEYNENPNSIINNNGGVATEDNQGIMGKTIPKEVEEITNQNQNGEDLKEDTNIFISATEQLETALTNGEPIWLMLRTRSCPACKELKKVFDELKGDYEGKITFIEVDLDDSNNRELAKKYKVMYVPETVLYDKEGNITFNEVGYFDKEIISPELDKIIK